MWILGSQPKASRTAPVLVAVASLAYASLAIATPAHPRQHQHAATAEHDSAMACPAHATKTRVSEETVSDERVEGLHQPGQAIFGALSEVLERLEADPTTDWSQVDLDALREHLVQMDLLFAEARVARQPLPDGMRFEVRGSEEVLEAAVAIGGMHAQMLVASAPSWQLRVEPRGEDVVFEVRSTDPAQQVKIRALGFAGLLTLGAHHADHHWAMATGGARHHH